MKRALVCVLDWGLGHATRSVPVVRELLRQGAEVILASSGSAGQLLKQEFPGLSYYELPGYRPRYPDGGSMTLSMAAQAFHFRKVIWREHKELEVLVKSLRVNVVISDNRYGCFSTHAPSVIITHQPVVRLASGHAFAESIVNGWLRRYLNEYKEIWVPDQPGSGLTDRFVPGTGAVRYIGWLSRFPTGVEPVGRLPIMAMVSGPEPQRALLEQKLRNQLRLRPGKSLLVTGVPGEERMIQDGNLEIVSHLSSTKMEEHLAAADLVISRSGYSTIMDMISLGKRVAFIPTPRQPEQLFFAHHLKDAGVAFCQDQENFTVDSLVQQSSRYSGFGSWQKDTRMLEPAIKQLLS